MSRSSIVTRGYSMARNPIHPGAHLAEELGELGMSAAALSRQLDYPSTESPRSSTANAVSPPILHCAWATGSGPARTSGSTCKRSTNCGWRSRRSATSSRRCRPVQDLGHKSARLPCAPSLKRSIVGKLGRETRREAAEMRHDGRRDMPACKGRAVIARRIARITQVAHHFPVGTSCRQAEPAILAAAITAWVRLSTPSFCRIAETCALMVASDTPSS